MGQSLNTTFKERVARRDGLLVPGAANALAAKIIEDTGFEALYVTGAGITNMHLGAPDIGQAAAADDLALHANRGSASQVVLGHRGVAEVAEEDFEVFVHDEIGLRDRDSQR